MGKLRDQMEMDMRLEGMSPKTISCYVGCMKAVAAHFGKSPAELSDDEIREYLHYLMEVRKTSQAVISPDLQCAEVLLRAHAPEAVEPCKDSAVQATGRSFPGC